MGSKKITPARIFACLCAAVMLAQLGYILHDAARSSVSTPPKTTAPVAAPPRRSAAFADKVDLKTDLAAAMEYASQTESSPNYALYEAADWKLPLASDSQYRAYIPPACWERIGVRLAPDEFGNHVAEPGTPLMFLGRVYTSDGHRSRLLAVELAVRPFSAPAGYLQKSDAVYLEACVIDPASPNMSDVKRARSPVIKILRGRDDQPFCISRGEPDPNDPSRVRFGYHSLDNGKYRGRGSVVVTLNPDASISFEVHHSYIEGCAIGPCD